ncbi:MAG: adenosylcobinamide-GDP ribazoletransferase [Clostridiales bacterium]|nr:adenosylcobinamide-GDP ribazoletransferase [Clostridiales bacterium]
MIFAFRYFTNLPIPADLKWNEKTAAASLAWLPFTGLSIGLCLSALALFMQNTGFPQYPLLKGMLMIALELWVGGALFVSGFSQACDGLFSGLGPGRSLTIMEDSHVGIKGMLSLVLSLLAKSALLAELSLYGDFLFVLLFYPCWARWAASFTVYHYPVAKEEGMAFFFKAELRPVYILLGSVFLLLTLIVMPRYFYLAVLLSFLLLLFCCSLVQSRLGGQTTDSYGLASVIAELSFLLFCAVCGVLFRHLT